MKRVATITASKQQQAVIDGAFARMLVRANAGAGKTTTMALKARDEIDRGLDPEEVLLLAFTAPGRQALRRALTHVGIAAPVARRVRVHTVNELAETILQRLEGRSVHTCRDAEAVKPFVLEAVRVARSRLKERHHDAFHIVGDGSLAVEGWLKAFRSFKGTMRVRTPEGAWVVTPASAAEVDSDFTTLAVYAAYERLRTADVVADAAGRLHHRDEIGPRFRYQEDATYDLAVRIEEDDCTTGSGESALDTGLGLIALDEMHDTNRAIVVVLRALLSANPGARFVGVGDRDQVIHAEAGADPAFLSDGFERELGRPVVLPLDATYRFGDAMARLLSSHAHKTYGTCSTRRTRVEVLAVASPMDQGLAIEHALAERTGLQPKSPNGELAVLLRHPSRAVGLENFLLDRGIDYEPRGFTSYLMRPEVLFVRALLTAAIDAIELIESDDVHAAMLEAVLLFGGSSIATTTGAIDAGAVAAQTLSVRRVVEAKSLVSFVRGQLSASVDRRVAKAIAAALDIAASNRIDDVRAAIRALDFESMAARVLVHKDAVDGVVDTANGLIEAVARFDSIESFLRGTNERELRLRSTRKGGCIVLSSIEASKGLEFDHVIVPGVDAHDFDGDGGDERNLFYVAASRAKHRLTLMHDPAKPGSYLRAVAQASPASATASASA